MNLDIPNEEPEDNTGPTCRFCYRPATPNRPLFFPCRCSGTMQHIHQDCLFSWIISSNNQTCPTCSFRFQFRRIYSPDLPETVGIRTILSTILSPITNVLSGLPAVLDDLLDITFVYDFVCKLVLFLTVARFRKHLYSESDWLHFPLQLVSPYDIVGDLFVGVFFIIVIFNIGTVAVVEQWKSTHEDRLPDWITTVTLTLRLFGLEDEEDMLEEEMLSEEDEEDMLSEDEEDMLAEKDEEDLPENRTRHQQFRSFFWNLTLEEKLNYIKFRYPFTRIPIACLIPLLTSVGLVMILEYFPLCIGKYVVGNLELGWFNYWLQLYLGYVPLTCTLWFIQNNWISERIQDHLDLNLEYIHSCLRVLIVQIFMNIFHPLLISFVLDLSLENLSHSSDPEEGRKFLDYSLWELCLYCQISTICISTISTLVEPILKTSLTPIEKAALPLHKLIIRLANRIWTTVSCIFLLFWMQTYFLPISLDRSNNAPSTWSENLEYLFIGSLLQTFGSRIPALVHRLVSKFHNETSRSILLTSMIVYSIYLSLLIAPIYMGRIFGSLVLAQGELSDGKNAIIGVVILWLMYHISSRSSEVVKNEGFTKFEKLMKVTAMVSKYTISVILLLGVVPFLLGLTLRKYLFQPIGSEIGSDCDWTTGTFLIELVAVIALRNSWACHRIFPTMYDILINGPYVPWIVLSSVAYLLIATSVPYVFSQAIYITLWYFGYGYVPNPSIDTGVYSGFGLMAFLLVLYILGVKLFKLGYEHVHSIYFVGFNLINFQQQNIIEQ